METGDQPVARWLDMVTDGRNALIAGLVMLAVMLGTIAMISTLADSPYARQDELDRSLGEMRARMNIDQSNQALMNHDLQEQINQLKKELK